MANCFSRRCSLEELVHLDGSDDSQYIQGVVFMVWPPRKNVYRIYLEVIEESTPYRFQVEIPYQDGMVFRPQDCISLGLKGVRVDQRKESNARHSLPIALSFPDGVILKYLSGKHAGKLVDTWDANTDVWYNLPSIPVVSVVEVASTSEPLVTNPPQAARNQHAALGPVPSFIPASHIALSPQFTKGTRRTSWSKPHKKRRLNEPDSVNAMTPPFPQTSTLADDSGREHDYHTNKIKPDGATKRPDVTTKQNIFTTLSDLRKGPLLINVVAIVAYANPERRTKTKEWSKSFALVDQSIADSSRPSVTVNCFQEKIPEWLPQVNQGDVVVLQKLKVIEFNGALSLIGYADKLCWAVYDPLTCSIRSPDNNPAPGKHGVNDLMGGRFSPYLELPRDGIELEHCQQIAGWWKARLESDEPPPFQPRRRHLLISEASPDLAPGGFFDCTVLQKFHNGQATTVYVTDYTVNPFIYPIKAAWCPTELCGYVLQCEMWDDARTIAEMMKPGEYWYLNNVRAKWNRYQHMEGTMQYAEKVQRLAADELEAQPRMRDFLARKRGLVSVSTTAYPPSETLLQDVGETTGLFSFIVELLYKNTDLHDDPFICVTDYTYNHLLPAIAPMVDCDHSLEHRVIKVRLDDAQVGFLSDIKPGSGLIIHNIAIKRSDGAGTIQGYLSGADRLIHVLDMSGHHFQTLSRNKENWLSGIVPSGPKTVSLTKPSTPSTIPLCEALSLPAPAVFTVFARIVDFFPFDIMDASVLRCLRCHPSTPPTTNQCPRCGDLLDPYGQRFYRLFVQLQDEGGDELFVSLSGQECTLLQGLDPADFLHDQAAFDRFLARVDPILGNLRDVHQSWSRNENKTIQTPLMTFTCENWSTGDGDEKGYSLLGYSPA
ncbi:hypothetical protein L210DRAFT_979877 [Boletus edulis BED1]|uniref:Protection of telomeres protein 1 n=1 Tax=Boletus edulis BED1 TaxID=1328754 RepID=A0AAD4G7B2_BOLED|nr:hypothetical protein L210DRAFT_979877 [Boletus edulis BED1]